MDGKRVQRIVLDTRGFWRGVVTCLKAALPLVKALRMVDSDENPAMGFIYEAMAQAKNQIKENFNGVEKNYKPILDIVDDVGLTSYIDHCILLHIFGILNINIVPTFKLPQT
ncbi:unnamed protein product [Amaranthus hypochondriacus]